MTTITLIFLQLQVIVAAYLLVRERKRLKLQAQQQESYTRAACDASREFFAEDLKNTIGVTRNIAELTAQSTSKRTAEDIFAKWLSENRPEIKKITGGK